MPPTIVHLSAEYVPFARTGGLAEAVNGLANVQARQGNPVVVFVPLYRSVREQAPDLAPLGRTYTVHLGPTVEEVRYFHTGQFPDVSSTGRWSDVGHYTQLIWRGTQQVGCAVGQGRANDILVCRYWPAGNVMGQPVN